MTAPAKHSTEADFEAFAATCERLAGFDDRLDPFYVDGWLAALATGPVRLPPEQWLELLCGDTFDRTFADPPDRAQALAALHARLDVLHSMLDAEALLDAPDVPRLDPFFDDWEAGLEEAQGEGAPVADAADSANAANAAEAARAAEAAAGHDAGPAPAPAGASHGLVGTTWAEGVLEGLEVLAAPGGPWGLKADDPTVTEVLEENSDQVLALLMERGGDPYREFLAKYHPGREPERDDLLVNACFALQDLRLFLLEHGPRPPTRRVEKAPGRNDPCPCGSGKKFKKCHGLAEA
jgi:uncharacterized protein